MEFESKDKLMEHAQVHMGNKQVSSGNMTKYNARKVIGGSVAGAEIKKLIKKFVNELKIREDLSEARRISCVQRLRVPILPRAFSR